VCEREKERKRVRKRECESERERERAREKAINISHALIANMKRGREIEWSQMC